MPTKQRQVCPLCGKPVKDRLIHLRINHEIEDIQQFMEVLQKVNKKEENRREFAEYVTELQAKKKQGLITPEDYRMLMTKWARDHG